MGGVAKKGVRVALYWLLVMLVVTVDQATKAAALEVLEHGPLTVIPGIIDFVLVKNTGAAFSMGEGNGVLFILIAVAALAGTAGYVVKSKDMPIGLAASMALVAGGGLGNMLDRIFMGAVTDFIKTTFISFPVFNVADMCVTVGVVMSVVLCYQWDSSEEAEPGEEARVTMSADKSEA